MRVITIACLMAAGCRFDNDKGEDLESAAQADVKAYIALQLDGLVEGAVAIESAAPDAAGWQAGQTDGLEAGWYTAREHYERIEGAIAVLFSGLDVSTDQRYDYFIAAQPDDDPFDDAVVIGNHAIERIVWADRMPAAVVAFESTLPFYEAARPPANEAEATDFRELLCGRFADETVSMQEQFEPLALDTASAFRGVISSMAEQYEKVNLASTGEDESRYSDNTLSDMRANLDGGRQIFRAFSPWLESLDGGPDLVSEIEAGFDRVEAGYGAIDSDGIPEVPTDWNPDAPSAADLATEYGSLWTLLSTEADPAVSGSLVERMSAAADLLGIAQI